MELRPYQREDVEEIKRLRCIGVFNEQRTGKTPTVCTALMEMGISKYIVVCPNSLLYMWKPAIEQWTGNTPIVYQKEKDVDLWKNSNVPIIIGYERLRGTTKKQNPLYQHMLRHKVDAVVLDEAHTIRNRKNLTYKACMLLARRTDVRIAMTGTPAYNTPQDVWAVINFIAPNYLGSYYDFCKKYFVAERVYTAQRVIEKPTSVYIRGKDAELANKIKLISIQRKRSDVLDWITDIEPTVIKLTPTSLQSKVIHNLEKYFEYEHIITPNILANMQAIRQLCADPALVNVAGVSPKTNWVVSFLKDNPDKRVIIFSLSTKYLVLLTKLLEEDNIKAATITGETKSEFRMKHVTAFQNNQVNVLLIQALCGKEGLTLDTADAAIFLDAYPPAGIYQQAKDRIIATSEDHIKPQEIIHVMLQDTYDERLFKLVEDNFEATEVLNDYNKYIHR